MKISASQRVQWSIGGLLVLSAVLTSCGHANNPPSGTGSEAPPASLTVISADKAASTGLVSIPWTLQYLDAEQNVLDLGYSYGGCQPLPSGVAVSQTDNAVVVALMAPREDSSVCTPNLRVGTSEVALPPLKGRAIRHAAISQ